MLTNPKLDALCNEFRDCHPDWGRLIDRVRSMRERAPEKVRAKGFDLAAALKQFSEQHLRVFCEDSIEDGNPFAIELDPVEEGTRRSGWLWRYNWEGGLYGQRKHDNAQREYDLLITVDGLPVMLEVKIARTKGFERVLGSKRNNRMLYPLRKLFDHEPGAMIIMPKDIYQKFEEGSGNRWDRKNCELYQRFRERGGIVTPLYATKDGFREDVQAVLKDLMKAKK